MPEISPSSCFRLRGEVDGAACSFVVDSGIHIVGSDAGADIVLAARGVSRRHARLQVHAGGLEVRDLESKNGTQINGQEVREGLALVGDELRFGPIALRIEIAAPDDARLGLLLEPLSSAMADKQVEETTWMAISDVATGEIRLDLLDEVLDRLISRPEADLDGAVKLVSAHAGALGAAFVEWSGDGEAISVAASGAIGAVPAGEALPPPESGRRCVRLRSPGPPKLDGVVLHQGDGAVGLLTWLPPATAEGRSRGHRAEVLALVLRLLESFRPRPVAPAPMPASVSEDPLRFSEHIVRGEAPSMVALYQQMSMLLQGDVSVLILGETGVGKEHLAQTLHASSARREGPFVAVNCAAIPSELLESEMFGIGRGVATGVQHRRGKFSEANGGSLFLDEIGDMPAELQAKLLRALQDKEIHPLGRAPEKVDVRVIAATNTQIRKRIADGRFREDLYFRLAGYVLRVPPLRERVEDLPRLVGHFSRRFCRETGKPIKGISLKALRRLSQYPWPGNVRELEHEIRRLVYVCPPHHVIDSEMISPHIVSQATEVDAGQQEKPVPEHGTAGQEAKVTRQAVDTIEEPELGERGLVDHLNELEVRLLRQALKRRAGNQSRAAKLLRISRNGLAARLRRHSIDAADFQP